MLLTYILAKNDTTESKAPNRAYSKQKNIMYLMLARPTKNDNNVIDMPINSIKGPINSQIKKYRYDIKLTKPYL